jgi:hypothetical protein
MPPRETLEEAKSDARIPPGLLAQMREVWEEGMVYGRIPR